MIELARGINRQHRRKIFEDNDCKCLGCGKYHTDVFLSVYKLYDDTLVLMCEDCFLTVITEYEKIKKQENAYIESLRRVNNPRLTIIYGDMLDRCYNSNSPSFKYYGARGISVCDEWRSDFKNFCKWAKENGYDAYAPRGECAIDRINNDGNYEPTNCRWVDVKTQCSNRRKLSNATSVTDCVPPTQQNDL